MKKGLVLVLSIGVLVAGSLNANTATSFPIKFTLANSGTKTARSGSLDISFRLTDSVGEIILDPDYPYNTAIGGRVFGNNTTGENNVAVGYEAMWCNTTGKSNTAIGMQALTNNIHGGANTAVGLHALFLCSEGNNNTAIGIQTLGHNTGWANTALGFNAGFACLNGNHNIFIGADVEGQPEDRNTIRIGSKYELNGAGAWVGQNQTFIGGIVENPLTAAQTQAVVGITSEGRLGTVPPELLPQGPQGPPGQQGPPGESLVSGSLLFLLPNATVPAGYSFIGSADLSLTVPETKKPAKVTINVYVKQ
jgi:hypothetical protein